MARALAAKKPPARGAPQRLVYGPWADNIWIVWSPLLALGLLLALWKWSSLSDLQIYAVLFAFIVTGHHLPGWFRAFGEPAVYRRYRARLWVSLAAVPALVILPTTVGLGAAALTVAALFDLWHVSMQQHGFGRIYAAKAGDTSRLSARLDLACVLIWYATAVAWSDPWMQGIARVFRKAGLPIFGPLSPEGWLAIRVSLLAASSALLAAYIAVAWTRWRRERIATPRKHMLHAVAFAVIVFSYQFGSWYRAQSVQNLFHALQYFFIVWIYGHLSLRRDPEKPAGFYRAMFRRGRGALVFAGCVGVYGALAMALSSSGYRLTGVNAERAAQVLGSIGLASLLLHFYVDSFIWKVRSRDVRAALAIGGNAESARTPVTEIREPALRGALHALGYFGIPIAAVLILGARARAVAPDREVAALAHEAKLFPRSAVARADYGLASLNAGDPVTGRLELESSVSLSPTLEGPALVLADLDRRKGDRSGELDHARLALRANPRDPAARYALGNALAGQRRLDEAEEQYREALRLKPNLAGAEENLGVLYKWRGQLDLAIPHFRRAHALDPDLSDAACNLAGALATLGQREEGLAVLLDYRGRHPQDRVAANLEAAIRGAAR